jgi:enamine deaminase RidA (YjgF/YER057c/UK114 family)
MWKSQGSFSQASLFPSHHSSCHNNETNTKSWAKSNIESQSQAVQVGQHIFVSGQIPADKKGNLVQGSIADKTKASCEGMKAILEEAGSSMSKVIKVSSLSLQNTRLFSSPF